METKETGVPWQRAAAVADIPEGEVIAARIGEKCIALYRVEGKVYATNDICTHEHAHLSDGYLDQWEIECPLHQARFDIRTGAVLCSPATCAVATYPVRVVGDEVQVKLDG